MVLGHQLQATSATRRQRGRASCGIGRARERAPRGPRPRAPLL